MAGVILELANPKSGNLEIDTSQGRFECDISTLGIDAQVWDCGGLDKELSVYRLPERGRPNEFAFPLPLDDLHPGDNPIYVRVTQEDGHMAWSSPIYAV